MEPCQCFSDGTTPYLRAFSRGILDAWFATPFGRGEDAENVSRVTQLEVKYGIKPRRKKRASFPENRNNYRRF